MQQKKYVLTLGNGQQVTLTGELNLEDVLRVANEQANRMVLIGSALIGIHQLSNATLFEVPSDDQISTI